MKKCDIVKDLMPSYIDGLTSKASNELVREHLKECPECKEYYEIMKEEIVSPYKIEKNKKELRPLRKWKKRIWKTAAATAAVCMIAFGGWTYYLQRTWLVDSSDVTISYGQVEGVTDLTIKPKKEGEHLTACFYDGNQYEAVIEAQKNNPFHRPLQKNAHVSFTYLDEDTINVEGKTIDLKGDEELKIKLADKTVKVNLKDFGNAEKWKDPNALQDLLD